MRRVSLGILLAVVSVIPAKATPSYDGAENARSSDAVLLPPMFVTPPHSPPVYGRALLRNWVPPDYPKDAFKEWLAGTVKLRLVIDKKGNVVSSRVLDATDKQFIKPAQDAVRKWTFSPALNASVPVACSMDTSVIFSPEDAHNRRKAVSDLPPEDEIPVIAPTTEATLNSTPEIDYPDSLFDRKLSGKAHFVCTVLANGRVTNPRILTASNVDFVLPALRAIRALQYNPRMQGDEPLAAEIEGDLKFDLAPSNAVGALAANMIAAPNGSEPAASIAPLTVVDPVFPYELLLKGEDGSATVAFTVGTSGFPTDMHVVATSEPEFGEALLAAVEASTFSTPVINGRSVTVSLVRQAKFTPSTFGSDSVQNPVGQLLASYRSGKIGNGSWMDSRLVPRYQVAPRYPSALKQRDHPSGQAVIEFVVDREGRARFPRIIACSAPEFGWAAATAVSQWVFDVPRIKDQPTAVRARIPFEFKAPTL
ncbi:MAG: TonB family protein [Opitutaceae bacterium]